MSYYLEKSSGYFASRSILFEDIDFTATDYFFINSSRIIQHQTRCPLKIKRIQVEEGFLHGLDLEFHDGLNVIIGPRGSGKTSIIELIRFCLGVEAYSPKFDERAHEHALGILRSGQVSLTIESNGQELIVSRTADIADFPPRFDIEMPIILSQGEIETIGLHEEGKLRLIDTFTPTPTKVKASELNLISEIRSLLSQKQSLSEEVKDIEEEIASLKGIEEELKSAETEREEIGGTIKAIQPQQEMLSEIADETTMLSVQQKVFSRTYDLLQDWGNQLENILVRQLSIEGWPKSGGEKDLLGDAREKVSKSIEKIQIELNKIKNIAVDIKELENKTADEKIQLEARAREIRSQIEEVQEGAGAIARKISDLREKQGQLDALSKLREGKLKTIATLIERRDVKLGELDQIRQNRFETRVNVVENLNSVLSPEIELKAIRSAIYSDYESAIIETLRGSGIRYSTLAPKLAQAMSPRELVEAIEESDPQTISRLADISQERADRLVSHAQSVGVEKVLTSMVEDGIRMSLFVAGEYRGTDKLSTGQRCTVILPILLSEHGRALAIDQPEDNLDNAYIVDTVIKSIKKASSSSQIICSTHNPNIPVLGEADLVVLLDSDRKRGFVRNANHLDHPSTVEAITNVMEGGREAFKTRAEFYSSYNQTNGKV